MKSKMFALRNPSEPNFLRMANPQNCVLVAIRTSTINKTAFFDAFCAQEYYFICEVSEICH